MAGKNLGDLSGQGVQGSLVPVPNYAPAPPPPPPQRQAPPQWTGNPNHFNARQNAAFPTAAESSPGQPITENGMNISCWVSHGSTTIYNYRTCSYHQHSTVQSAPQNEAQNHRPPSGFRHPIRDPNLSRSAPGGSQRPFEPSQYQSSYTTPHYNPSNSQQTNGRPPAQGPNRPTFAPGNGQPSAPPRPNQNWEVPQYSVNNQYPIGPIPKQDQYQLRSVQDAVQLPLTPEERRHSQFAPDYARQSDFHLLQEQHIPQLPDSFEGLSTPTPPAVDLSTRKRARAGPTTSKKAVINNKAKINNRSLASVQDKTKDVETPNYNATKTMSSSQLVSGPFEAIEQEEINSKKDQNGNPEGKSENQERKLQDMLLALDGDDFIEELHLLVEPSMETEKSDSGDTLVKEVPLASEIVETSKDIAKGGSEFLYELPMRKISIDENYSDEDEDEDDSTDEQYQQAPIKRPRIHFTRT